MVTGALKRNKRNRKSMNYQNGNRIKILSGENITLEKIYSRYKNGCLVGLENFANSGKRVVVDEIDFEKKIIGIAYPSLGGNICWATYKFNGTKSDDYAIKHSFGIVSQGHFKYNQLNDKLKELNKI